MSCLSSLSAQTVFVYMCTCVFMYLCICVFSCQTLANIDSDILVTLAFQKYSIWDPGVLIMLGIWSREAIKAIKTAKKTRFFTISHYQHLPGDNQISPTSPHYNPKS